MNHKSTRRSFIENLTRMAAGVALLGTPARSADQQAAVSGERYAGFVIYPEGEPPPAGIVYPSRPSITEGRVDIGDISRAAAARVLFPVYGLRVLPGGTREGRMQVERASAGEVRVAHVTYEEFNQRLQTWVSAVSISSQPNVPSPYPIARRTVVGADGVPVEAPVKTSLTPTPGLRFDSRKGSLYLWITPGVLHLARFEHRGAKSEAQDLVRAIRQL